MTKNITAKTNTKARDRKEESKNSKEINYLETFKEMYGRTPSQEELKAFIECMCLKKEEQKFGT